MKRIILLGAAALVSLALIERAQAWPTVRSVDTKTYALAHDGTVAVDDASGDVAIVGWNSDRVEITETKTALSDDDLQRIGTRTDSRSDRISIAAELPSHCFSCDVSLRIRVPQRAHVTVASSSGDVSVKSVAGPARVDSSSGDVEIRDVGGEVHVHTSSGDIKLENTTSTVEAFSSSGDINARDLAADVNLVASSGAVTAEFARFAAVHLVRMESSSGDISLTVPRGVGFKIEATTSSGSIDSNLHLPIRERDSGSDVVAQVGEGKAAVQLRATSGNIDVTMR